MIIWLFSCYLPRAITRSHRSHLHGPQLAWMNVTILLSMHIALSSKQHGSTRPSSLRCLILLFGAVQIHSFDPFYLVHTTCFDNLALIQSTNLLAARPSYCYNNHKKLHVLCLSTMTNHSGGRVSKIQYATHFNIMSSKGQTHTHEPIPLSPSLSTTS
jgi:hypothetical protein